MASTTDDLLYVSNFLSGEVNAYYYKDGRIGAKALSLTGFREPAGLCTNKDGDVFITDGDGMIYRYHHGATGVFRKIHDTGRPFDCSISPTTADMAVANREGIRIFPADGHKSVAYKAPGFNLFWAIAYDNEGDVFITGSAPHLFELPLKGSQIEPVAFRPKLLTYPLGIVFTNPDILFAASLDGKDVGYKVRVRHDTAKVVSVIPLDRSKQALTLAVRAGNVIVPDYYHNAVRVYSEATGTLVSQLSSGLDGPYGAVVSQPPPK